MLSVDLNCDMGEGFGNYSIGNDRDIINYVSSVNIACGFHAGDPVIMDKTVKLALEKGVAIGAHPAFPDLLGFGRRNMIVSSDEAKAYVIYQVGALKAFVEANGGELNHVKPHGALYNMAASDYKLARAIAEAIYDIDSSLSLIGLANSKLIEAAAEVGIKGLNEVFADRAHSCDGTLVSRSIAGSVIHDVNQCYNRVLGMVKEGKIKSMYGKDIVVKADTICIHGDNEMALEFAKNINIKLKEEGISIKSINKGRRV
ncbi:LamB/YcsF family protein [Alkaliphilus pronyensis]|uniref:5-oxoprolinase subunit A n=1 Tax=Alkaliphilus pronyensis TaxID=1482732 RepID=A0A6I0EXY2_9FIRM|nr:5-oxoprolinase subunit PxpA [Alkaliphilus pronyensis]KAB3532759.1 LamB/YcsF family protein [Alkaliphilus pronyensis]